MRKIVGARRAAIAASLLLSGCASIVNGTNQVVSIDAKNNGQAVGGVLCRLENGKGVFFVTAPGTVTIHRAYEDLLIRCEKENLQPGTARVKSYTKATAYGNILLGGVIGAAVDVSNGSAYDYPSVISIVMGQGIHIPEVQAPSQMAVSTFNSEPTALSDSSNPPATQINK
ncbi:MAG TPA: hypothetical protein VK832_03490 [Burkholderiaceae bacterium]|jgi:hypothetical protein|nr:hypothetical protein [Burkholderiaceae bacterium]